MSVRPCVCALGLVLAALSAGPAPAAEQPNVIVFLASDYSSYMTGEVVAVSCQRA